MCTRGSRVGRADAEEEFDDLAARRAPKADVFRPLHAKILLLEGSDEAVLAMGSFNATRRGMGVFGNGNAEAGLLWRVPARRTTEAAAALAFAGRWELAGSDVTSQVRAPDVRKGDAEHPWPRFLLSLRATRTHLDLEGDGGLWPERVTIRMADLRGRAEGREFDPWVVERPSHLGDFAVRLDLRAAWIAGVEPAPAWPALPDLEATLTWPGGAAVVPVLFVEKHTFPVMEARQREDERALIAFFLGLVPEDAAGDGLGHSIEPLPGADAIRHAVTSDILSYHIRDFVRALPGVAERLRQGAFTETGLRTALFGPRSALELAREAAHAARAPAPGAPRKTGVSVVFQLAELHALVAGTALNPLADGATERLRAEALASVRALVDDALARLSPEENTPVLRTFLARAGVS